MLIFLRQAMLDYCISLNSVQKFLVVSGVVDMCHLLLIGVQIVQITKRRHEQVFITHYPFFNATVS